MKEKNYNKTSIILMIISAFLLFGAFVYCDYLGKIKDYKYVDNDEYESVNSGLIFIEKLPIHFNILNKYFSNMNNLSQKEKEEIVLAYAIKNNYKLYECGPSNSVTKYLCINKEDLKSKELMDIFNLNLNFENKNIDIYVDNYGTYTLTTNDASVYYQIVLNNSNNKMYRMYTKFDHYKQEKDIYIFYVYQGYYKANCNEGEALDLYDFMSGKVVYSDKCNNNHEFIKQPGDDVKKLQLYKYELKKNKEGNFYLYGYNPVNNE